MNSTRPPSPGLNSAHTTAQAGNALFLILIAVALFAALSYAVTSSGRGGGSVDREKVAIAAAEMIQYAQTLRAAAQRMMIVDRIDAEDIVMCASGEGPVCKESQGLCTTGANCLFAPEGGDVTPQRIPDILAASGSDGEYAYAEAPSADGQDTAVWNVGTNHYLSGAEVLVLTGKPWTADGLTKEACEEINKRLGLALPIQQDSADFDNWLDGYYGEPVACIDTDSSAGIAYKFYLAIAER